MKGQMMLITSVIISLILITTGSAVADLGDRNYNYRDEGYMTQVVKDEAARVDTRFQKNRENFRKMINSMDGYTTSVEYSEINDCFNVSMKGRDSEIYLQCIS